MALDLWGNEIVVESKPAKAKKKKQQQKFVRDPERTDIGIWLSKNKPKTLADCADLKQALRTKSQAGKYCYTTFGTRNRVGYPGIRGPESALMLVSPAARRHLTKRVNAIEEIIKIYLQQFGTEQPVFEKSKPIADFD
jgi:hypothetical protein